ncbi:MAG: hypothetical protein KDJ50_04095 [Alphaproteobacteria bacterium]|nr:hypothetical protein [Alphaproteobacteria bacterium]
MSIVKDQAAEARRNPRLKQDHELTVADRVQEISCFSKDFLSAVVGQRALQSELQGGGYALTSTVRDDFHVPTGTAAFSVSHLMTRVREVCDARQETLSEQQLDILQQAADQFQKAAKFIRADYSTEQKFGHIADNVDSYRQDMNVALQELARRVSP